MNETIVRALQKALIICFSILFSIGFLMFIAYIPVYASENPDSIYTDAVSSGMIQIADEDELIHICIYLDKSVDIEDITDLAGSEYAPEEWISVINEIYEIKSKSFIAEHISGTDKESMYYYDAEANKIAIKATKGEIAVYEQDDRVDRIIIYELQIEVECDTPSGGGDSLEPPMLPTESFFEMKVAAMANLLGYKDFTDYRSNEQKELKEILDEAIGMIDSAYSSEQIETIVLEAEWKMDQLKTDAQWTKEEEKRPENKKTEDPNQECSNKEEPNKEESNKEEPNKEEPNKEESNKEEPNTGNNSDKRTTENLKSEAVKTEYKNTEYKNAERDVMDSDLVDVKDASLSKESTEISDEYTQKEAALESSDTASRQDRAYVSTVKSTDEQFLELFGEDLKESDSDMEMNEEQQSKEGLASEQNTDEINEEKDRKVEAILLIGAVSAVISLVWYLKRKHKIVCDK